MNISNIKIEQELKQSHDLWVPAKDFVPVPRRWYWIYVPEFGTRAIAKALGARNPNSTTLHYRGKRYEVTHVWTGLTRPKHAPGEQPND